MKKIICLVIMFCIISGLAAQAASPEVIDISKYSVLDPAIEVYDAPEIVSNDKSSFGGFWDGRYFLRMANQSVGNDLILNISPDGLNVIKSVTIPGLSRGVDRTAKAGNNIVLFKASTYMDIYPFVAGHRYGDFGNSPMVILDENYDEIGRKTFAGYCYYECTIGSRLYFRKEDYSQIAYGEYSDEKVIFNYYYTDNGLDWVEISKEEMDKAKEEASTMQNNISPYNFSYERIPGKNPINKYYLQSKSNGKKYEIAYEYPAAPYSARYYESKYGIVEYYMGFGDPGTKDEKGRTWGEGEQWVNLFSLDGLNGVFIPDSVYTNYVERWCTDEYMYIRFLKQLYKIPIRLLKSDVTIALDDKILAFEQPPVVEDGRTLVPMRFLFECLGDKVTWDEETRSVTAENKNSAVTFSLDSLTADVNGTEQTMDVPAKLIGDKTYVPLRFLSENLGYTVTWDEASNTAIVETK